MNLCENISVYDSDKHHNYTASWMSEKKFSQGSPSLRHPQVKDFTIGVWKGGKYPSDVQSEFDIQLRDTPNSFAKKRL